MTPLARLVFTFRFGLRITPSCSPPGWFLPVAAVASALGYVADDDPYRHWVEEFRAGSNGRFSSTCGLQTSPSPRHQAKRVRILVGRSRGTRQVMP
jgi:hypothetical protein